MRREYPPRYELWEFIASLTYEEVQQEYLWADRSLPTLIQNESLITLTYEHSTSTRLSTASHRRAA